MQSEKILYQVGQLPIFQNRMYDSELEAVNCPRGDVTLVENLDTGLVYNASFQPQLMVYDAHYQNEQSTSPFFLQHLKSVALIIERNMGTASLVEVGCGKGTFLEMLLADGFDIVGFDPTYEGTNPRVDRRYFEPDLGIKANGLILRHVLEHIQNPFDFLMRLRDANDGAGLIYIEVPCFDWICKHHAWFDIFYEHVNYFRLSDFDRMFERVLESGRTFGDQYLYVIADLTSLKPPKYDEKFCTKFPADFVSSLSEQNVSSHSRTAVWGGASKGVIFTLLKSQFNQSVDTVIDINPAKQGKFLPASGLKVQSPADALRNLPDDATIFIMNSNYLHEIQQMSNNRFKYVSIDHD